MNLKKRFLFFIFAFTASIVFSQNGYAYYKKQLSSINEETANGYMKQALKQLKNQEYELSFNKNSALFKHVEALSVETNTVVEAFTKSISGFSGNVFFDQANQTVIHEKEFSGSPFLIYKSDVNWVLSRDTLKIDNYLCYKATTSQTIENSQGTHKLQITAWYAPEISLPYGPDGYGGLPGLILQLENNGITTTIKRIEFVKNKIVAIALPTKGKEMTEEDFNALVKNRFENKKEN